jgi:hypothetical protein
MFAHDAALDNPQALHDLAGELLAYARTAATHGTAVHDVERGIWQRLLQLGRTTLGHFFALQGSGDLGDTGCDRPIPGDCSRNRALPSRAGV